MTNAKNFFVAVAQVLTVAVDGTAIAYEAHDGGRDAAEVFFACLSELESMRPWGGCEGGMISAETRQAIREECGEEESGIFGSGKRPEPS